MVDRIVSGGQSGVDRAALDVAITLGIPCGGWCPRGRRAEDGPIDDRYPLIETPKRDYAQRTEWNVRDSDGTLIITRGQPSGGTELTVTLARAGDKPHLIIDLDQVTSRATAIIREWITTNQIGSLNIAGPRASQFESIYDDAYALLKETFHHGHGCD